MTNNKIIYVTAPINSFDGSNKLYVDSMYSSLIESVINLSLTSRQAITLSKPLTNMTNMFVNIYYNNVFTNWVPLCC